VGVRRDRPSVHLVKRRKGNAKENKGWDPNRCHAKAAVYGKGEKSGGGGHQIPAKAFDKSGVESKNKTGRSKI